MNLIRQTLPLIAFTAASSAFGLVINFSSGASNILGDEFGAPLAGGSLIQVGTWDGSSFSVLGSTTSDNTYPGSFSADSLSFDSTSIVGDKLAIRWYDTPDTTGYWGLVSSTSSSWDVVLSTGAEFPETVQYIDLANLTTASGFTLAGSAVLVNATFGPGTTPDGPPLDYGVGATPVFQMIPEPSTYAAFAGVLALGLVAWKRRRA